MAEHYNCILSSVSRHRFEMDCREKELPQFLECHILLVSVGFLLGLIVGSSEARSSGSCLLGEDGRRGNLIGIKTVICGPRMNPCSHLPLLMPGINIILLCFCQFLFVPCLPLALFHGNDSKASCLGSSLPVKLGRHQQQKR